MQCYRRDRHPRPLAVRYRLSFKCFAVLATTPSTNQYLFLDSVHVSAYLFADTILPSQIALFKTGLPAAYAQASHRWG
ncbi:hypothetical protein LMG28138_06072 [Pararobbsia alpina]|uniref:Uncharacterized protein n=1 Tax=Pararobbsia alpina TaxID=621374 RepID=A0A6S7BYT4_9BURK|nr:hypothetical protein LMG28138_06072 [Pararobbsia alpina]